ncbi:uncharacterized protein LOC100369804 [Saccoglossus kowalevskii]|uniref:Tetratricopeptide repeat protein 32-like n=1 Tax=Saccoglossus kowalevskii TaxID=10224 RepID=A0ABM0GL73_SACKO|nr:PREDICTED: tetratricopeptide repeat protein 32-like [Saccoglossus kowalevskii]
MSSVRTLKTLLEEADKASRSSVASKAEDMYTTMIDTALKLKLSESSITDAERNEISCDLALAYNNRGQLRYLRVEFVMAVDDYSNALKHNPQFAVAYYNRGQVHYRLSRFDEAIKDMNQALKLNPHFEEAKLALDAALKDKEMKEVLR